jgi:hypothetical protein
MGFCEALPIFGLLWMALAVEPETLADSPEQPNLNLLLLRLSSGANPSGHRLVLFPLLIRGFFFFTPEIKHSFDLDLP